MDQACLEGLSVLEGHGTGDVPLLGVVQQLILVQGDVNVQDHIPQLLLHGLVWHLHPGVPLWHPALDLPSTRHPALGSQAPQIPQQPPLLQHSEPLTAPCICPPQHP